MGEPLTPEAEAAIRARLARMAASLPWAAVPDRAHHGLVRDLTGEAVADVYCGDRAHAPVIADFIAHAPEDLAALLAEVERLRARIGEHECCYARGVADERARAVAWLRESVAHVAPHGQRAAVLAGGTRLLAADALERGEHEVTRG